MLHINIINLFRITWWFKFKEIKEYNKMFPNHKCIPKIRFGKYGWMFMFPINTNKTGKIFDIYGFDLMWKDKYNTPRYENFPYIAITFFKKWQIGISFIIDTSNIPKDKWESTQDYWWEKYLQKKYYGKTKREN